MPVKYNLSHQEYTIMSFLWQKNQQMSLAEVAQLLHSKGFSITTGTIKTYLQRLIKKGALKAKKSGRNLLYYVAMDETTYSQSWTRSFVEQYFDNSLSNFLLAFSGNKTLTEKEKIELKKLLDD